MTKVETLLVTVYQVLIQAIFFIFHIFNVSQINFDRLFQTPYREQAGLPYREQAIVGCIILPAVKVKATKVSSI